MSDIVGPCIVIGVAITIATFFARWADTDEAASSVAAGVLWPIYLPYLLARIIWERRP